MATISIGYIVSDVDAAIEFYRERLGFNEEMHPAPTFAMLSRGDMRLVLSAPGGGPGGGQAKQVLIEDPSGNPIELFEPTLPEAKLADGR
jgi:hypothetical protein